MKRTAALAVALMLAVPLPTWAQQKNAVELKTSAAVEVVKKNEKGEKAITLVDAAKATKTPGDVIVFTTTYKNNGTKPADAVVITNPVPEHMVYVEGSATGGNTKIDFSVNSGKTYGAPDKLTIKEKTGERKATAADYTTIRWTLIKSIPAGGTGNVSFKAKIK